MSFQKDGSLLYRIFSCVVDEINGLTNQLHHASKIKISPSIVINNNYPQLLPS